MISIKALPTIDQCVDYLKDLGCEWSYEKEMILQKAHSYRFRDIVVLYDPHELIWRK